MAIKTFLTTVALPLLFSQAFAAPYFRVGLFVEEPISGEEEGAKRYLSFGPSIAPGDEKKLRLFADSSAPATILVIVVDRATKDISKQWLPMMWHKKEAFSDIQYPVPAAGIPYQQKVTLDIFVVLFPGGASQAEVISRHLVQLQKLDPTKNSGRWLLHAGAIRKQVDLWFQEQNQERCVAQYRPPARAATQRAGSAIPILWREGHLVHKFVIEDSNRPFVARIPVVHIPTPDDDN